MSNPARHVIYASQRRERSSRNNVKMQKKCEGQHLHGGCNINLNDLEWCHHGWSMMVVETHMFLKMLGWNRIISHQMRSWRAVTVLRLLCFRIVLIHCGCICEWWWTYVFYILYYLYIYSYVQLFYIKSQLFFDMSVLFASYYTVFQQQRLFNARFQMEINETEETRRAEVRRFRVW